MIPSIKRNDYITLIFLYQFICFHTTNISYTVWYSKTHQIDQKTFVAHTNAKGNSIILRRSRNTRVEYNDEHMNFQSCFKFELYFVWMWIYNVFRVAIQLLFSHDSFDFPFSFLDILWYKNHKQTHKSRNSIPIYIRNIHRTDFGLSFSTVISFEYQQSPRSWSFNAFFQPKVQKIKNIIFISIRAVSNLLNWKLTYIQLTHFIFQNRSLFRREIGLLFR